MNIYQKLSKCRLDLQKMKLQKSGVNKFAGYNYYELADFLPTINELFDKVGLCAVVSFGTDVALMTITDMDKPEDTIMITSPMAGAELKGCHPIQNLGATETYTRRYLYMTALEIVEQDALDGSEPILKTTKPAVKGTATSTTKNNPDISAQATQLYWCFVGDKPGQLQMSKEDYNALTKELAAKKIISNSYSKEWTQSDVDEVRKIYNEKAGITEDTEEEEVLPF
jgi:hypothetical protein